jgi:uroporphyrinogen decarboxylase
MVDKLLLKNLNRQIAPPSVWMMRQAGRFLPEYRKLREQADSFWNLCFTPELAAEATLQPIRRFGFDAAIIFSDILVIPESLGQKVNFLPHHGPQLEPIDWGKFLPQAEDRDIHETLASVYQALKIVRSELPENVTLIGFSGTPWTIATYMIDLGKSATHTLSYQALEQPVFLKSLITVLTQAVTTYVLAQIRAGAEVIQLFDSWAGLIPPSSRNLWLVEPLKNIVTMIHENFPNFPIIYYGRGVSEIYPQLIQEIPGLAFSADQHVSPKWLATEVLPYAPLQGNLDPETLAQGGAVLRHRVEELLNIFDDRGYIFNLGHGILPNTPIDHVRYVVDRVKLLRF